MKRVLVIIGLGLIPLGLFIAAWQAFSYYQTGRQVSDLERTQQDLLEANKRLIAEYAAITSPSVIEERATKELHMVWPRQDQIVRLTVKSGDGQ